MQLNDDLLQLYSTANLTVNSSGKTANKLGGLGGKGKTVRCHRDNGRVFNIMFIGTFMGCDNIKKQHML